VLARASVGGAGGGGAGLPVAGARVGLSSSDAISSAPASSSSSLDVIVVIGAVAPMALVDGGVMSSPWALGCVEKSEGFPVSLEIPQLVERS
jgi:hypothetical protein